MIDTYRAEISELLDRDVTSLTRLGGGDVAEAFELAVADGTPMFAKTKRDADADFFSTEAVGLEWLRQPGAISVPEVIAVGTEPPWLVLEWIDTGVRGPDETAFGTALAHLHLSGAESFGRTDGCPTGSRRLPNDVASSWSGFLAANRLEPLIELAKSGRALPDETLEDVASIVSRLDVLLGPDEPPARLHGDLWAGNRMVGANGESWLIDPACFGGHREFDLAMMQLFGGFGRDAFDAYQSVLPLAPGWQERVQLHQLVPLMVHAIKFGGHYVSAAASVAHRYA